MSLSRKAINFDLSTNELKKHFTNTAEAYNQIKDFMLENGFEHRQYSGYHSKELMTDKQVYDIADSLARKFSWLSTCLKELNVADIGEQHNLTGMIKNQARLIQQKQESLEKGNAQNRQKVVRIKR